MAQTAPPVAGGEALADGPPTNHEAAAAASAADPLPDAGGSELRVEMDELRILLDAAFSDVIARTDRLEHSVGALVQRANLDTGSDEPGRSSTTEVVALMRGVQAKLDELLAASQAAARRSQPDPVIIPAPEVDLSRIESRLLRLSELISAQVEDRNSLDIGIGEVRRELVGLRSRPAVLDTKAVADAARHATLPNAADIASVRREVAGLTEAVRKQESSIKELHEALDWIKQRLMNR